MKQPMKRLASLLFAATLLGAAAPALAEKADAYKPTEINCRKCEADSVTGVFTMEGKVEVIRGTLRIDADRGRVERPPQGYQRVILEADAGKKVRFRQKGDGAGEQWVEGEAERVEYEEETGLVKLFSKARVQRLQDRRLTDEALGEFISYDSIRELFSLRNTNTGEDRPGGGRNTIILQPKRSPPAPAIAGTR
jgi:lipopolysaccharide export system protein LptA